jgi:transcriptional regulator with XRE-family HTH domain
VSTIRIVAESKDTVTISRDDWETLQGELQELQDCAAVAERRAYERLVGKENARRDYLTGDEAMRLLNGDNPLKVWREKRGLSQRALATAADIANGYLAEIESGRKPGSDGAFHKLAAVLQVPSDDLRSKRYRMYDPDYGPVLLSLNPASAGVAPGNRGAWVDRMDFPTLRDALDFVREQWSSLPAREPRIADIDHWPIYSAEDLLREIEGLR